MDVIVQVYNPGTWEVETGGSEVQGLHIKLEGSLASMRPGLKHKKKQNNFKSRPSGASHRGQGLLLSTYPL